MLVCQDMSVMVYVVLTVLTLNDRNHFLRFTMMMKRDGCHYRYVNQ